MNALTSIRNCCLASAGDDQKIIIWNVDKKKLMRTLIGHSSEVNCLAVSPQDYLISGSSDVTIAVWDLKSFSLLKHLTGHMEGVFALAMHENGLLSS